MVDGGTRATFEVVVGRRQFTIMSNGNTSLKELKTKFLHCAQLPKPGRYGLGCQFGRIVYSAASAPFKLTEGVCTGLEKLGARVKGTPDALFHTPRPAPVQRFVPENIATGLAAGAGLMLYGLAGGLFGLISEPVKCVKKRGIKGVPAGLGKGFLGLVCKPVGGTIDFVTCTIRGVNNMPRSLYRGIKKIKVRKEGKKEETEPRKTLEPLRKAEEAKHTVIEEEGKEDKDLSSVLHTLTTRKQELLRELSQLQSHSSSPFLTEEDEAGDDSFRTANNEDNALTESQYYGSWHLALEIEAARKEIRRISETIGRLSEAGSPCKEKDAATVLIELSISTQSALQWIPIDEDSDYRLEAADSKGGLKLPTCPVRPIVKSFFSQSQVDTLVPYTTLHILLNHALCLPTLVMRAALVGSYKERVKLVVVEALASWSLRCKDASALEAKLGETLYGEMENEAQLYAEKTGKDCTHMHIEGPEGLFQLSGYSIPYIKHHINSITVTSTQVEDHGKRTFRFPDGQLVTHTLPSLLYTGTLLGQTRCEVTGSVFFEDKDNGITCEIRLNSEAGRPSDYLEGALMVEGEVRACLKGTYLGWLEWDEVRYWDVRFCEFDCNVSSNISPSIRSSYLPTQKPGPTLSACASPHPLSCPVVLSLRSNLIIQNLSRFLGELSLRIANYGTNCQNLT